MNSIDEIMNLVGRTMPGYAVVCRRDSDGAFKAVILHAGSLLKNLKVGVNKFPTTSNKSALEALQASYSWACHYLETKKVFSNEELLKASLFSVDK